MRQAHHAYNGTGPDAWNRAKAVSDKKSAVSTGFFGGTPCARTLWLQVIFLLMFAGTWGCAGTGSRTGQGALPNVPVDFRLLIGEGGGFTGSYAGYLVHADGSLYEWRSRSAAEDTVLLARLTPAQLEALRERVAQGLTDADFDETGNVSAFIDLTDGGRRRRVTWVRSAAEEFAEAARLEDLYRHLLSLLSGAIESR
jgi:hypothetical protein